MQSGVYDQRFTVGSLALIFHLILPVSFATVTLGLSSHTRDIPDKYEQMHGTNNLHYHGKPQYALLSIPT
jgi:hypothetical protein